MNKNVGRGLSSYIYIYTGNWNCVTALSLLPFYFHSLSSKLFIINFNRYSRVQYIILFLCIDILIFLIREIKIYIEIDMQLSAEVYLPNRQSKFWLAI